MPDISVKNIKGVGAKTTQYLDKLCIRTVNDLLKHYPVDIWSISLPQTLEI